MATPKQEYSEFQVVANIGYEPPTPSVPPKTLQFPSALQHTTHQEGQPPAEADENFVSLAAQSESSTSPQSVESVSESVEAAEESQARHPLLRGRSPQMPLSNAIIKVPDTSTIRPKMEMPESEFAIMSEPLSVIQPLPQPKSSVAKRQPTLTVIATHEPKEIAIGAHHSLTVYYSTRIAD